MISSNKVDTIVIDKGVLVSISKDYFEYVYERVNDYELKIPLFSLKKIVFYKQNYNSSAVGCNIFSMFYNINAAENLTETGGALDGRNEESIPCKLVIKYSDSNDEKEKWKSQMISWPRMNKKKADEIIKIVLSYKKDVIIKYY